MSRSDASISMDTFAYYYLWFFLVLQIITLLKAYAVLGTPQVSFKNRLLTSAFHLARGSISVFLGIKLLQVLELETIEPLWIMVAVAAFCMIETIAVWLVEHRLLGKALPTLKVS